MGSSGAVVEPDVDVLAAPHLVVEGVGVGRVVVVARGVDRGRVVLGQFIVRSVGLLRDMDPEVGALGPVGLLEVAVRIDLLEPDLTHEPAHVVLAQREHVEVVHRTVVVERVPETGEPVVDVLGLRGDGVAAVEELVLRREPVVEDLVVVALIEDQDAVVLEHRVELGQRLAAVPFVEQVGERVPQADDGVVLTVDVAVEPAPVGLDHAQDVPVLATVLESLREHLRTAVGGDRLETGLQELDRVEPGARRDVENLLDPAGAELVDEERPLAGGATLPADVVVPLVHEPLDVFLLVVVRVSDLVRVLPELLMNIGLGVGLLEASRGVGAPVCGCGHVSSGRR